MKRFRSFARGWACLGVLIVLLGACGLFLPPAAAQKGEVPTPAPARPDYTVVPLKYVDAVQSSQMLTELLTPDVHKRVRIVVDARTNSLLISATPEDWKFLKKAVEILDQNRRVMGPQEQRFKVFHLHNIAIDDAYFEKGLATVFPKNLGKFSIDYSRRMVIVSGEEDALRATEEFLKAIDVPQAKPIRVPSQMRVRLVWLASGLSRKDAAPPPKDLKNVTDELAALGIEDLRTVSQSFVNVIGQTEFTSQGVTQLDYPCSLSVEGQVQLSEVEKVLSLSINAQRVGESKSPPLCKVSTTVRLPMGRSVVLGVTPTEKSTSVFVVQLLD